MLGLQMCASEPNLESNIFRGGEENVELVPRGSSAGVLSARRGSPLSGAGGGRRADESFCAAPSSAGSGTHEVLGGLSPPAVVQVSVAQSPPEKRNQRTRRSRVSSSTGRKPLGAQAGTGRTIALRGGRQVRGLRLRAWSPPLRGPRWQERAGRRSGAVAGGGQTAPPPSCPRASEPAAPPSRLLTPNILVRAECGERAENIPPRGRGETPLPAVPAAPSPLRRSPRGAAAVTAAPYPAPPHGRTRGGRGAGNYLICSNRRAELHIV